MIKIIRRLISTKFPTILLLCWQAALYLFQRFTQGRGKNWIARVDRFLPRLRIVLLLVVTVVGRGEWLFLK